MITCGERASTSFRTPSGPDSAGRRTNGDGAAPAGIRLSSRLVPPQDDLTSQVALVTGGGRGIGAGIASELAAAGARVAVSARTREQVEAVAREIGGPAIVADVADRAAVEAMVQQVEAELGPIDLLVANAGRNVREQRAW